MFYVCFFAVVLVKADRCNDDDDDDDAGGELEEVARDIKALTVGSL